MAGARSRFGEWWEIRLGWELWTQSLSRREVPAGHPGWYLGGAALMLFGLQVASGALLLLHYQPVAEQAFGSVQAISSRLPFGDLLRGVHVHSGNLLLAVVLLGLFVGLLRRSYVAPRELVWLSGVALLVLCAGMTFTGAVLPWTRDAYLQARVGSGLAGHMPLVGDAVLRFLRGGEDISSATLQRAFGFHVAVLPATITVVLVLHLNFLRSAPESAARAKPVATIAVYPDFLVRLAALWVAILVLVVSLATFVELPLGERVDLATPISGVPRPGWYLLFVHQLLRSAPPRLLGLESATFVGGALTGLFVLVIALPFLDRRGSRVTVALGCVGAGLAALLTAYALL
jgi:quinol-cytochrome oxidoreductase complex cytochrome b subunit